MSTSSHYTFTACHAQASNGAFDYQAVYDVFKYEECTTEAPYSIANYHLTWNSCSNPTALLTMASTIKLSEYRCNQCSPCIRLRRPRR